MNFWLVRTEPGTYSWQKFVQEGRATWDGVRNFQARNNLKKMKAGDQVLFYHSDVGKEIVGVAEVIHESYPDPTAGEGNWVVVDLRPLRPLSRPVKLEQVKREPALNQMWLVRHSRLSVMPVESREFEKILEMSLS